MHSSWSKLKTYCIWSIGDFKKDLNWMKNSKKFKNQQNNKFQIIKINLNIIFYLKKIVYNINKEKCKKNEKNLIFKFFIFFFFWVI